MARVNSLTQERRALVTIATRPSQSLRLRGRSYLALVLVPEPPLSQWLAELDAWIGLSPGFFGGRLVVLDLSGLAFGRDEIVSLLADLDARAIRIVAIEGADPNLLGLGMPPVVSGGRPAGAVEVVDPQAVPAPPAEPTSLLIEDPVRSGQRIVFPHGDVTVLGSVASGAEVMAGGSIHVYGTLRGRAIAGFGGNARARIFCRKFEAELLAIDGLYKTADDMDPQFRRQPVQAWLEHDAIRMAAIK